ncbi:hypothetical protein CTM46_09905 [Prevotella intermedia]|uniref:Uncharacterized protein n=1 Tax=Prevotella intermedia TaxID=28131 RepID=A0A2D3LMQ3_PREIN|nr:hypothetical protein CTM46_09905 [Prevotella intermedia]
MQKSRFWNVKSKLWFFYGIIFTKQEWFYVVEGVKVVAWLRTAAQWLFADSATLARVVGAFASARCGGSFGSVGFG